ncbi:MAG: MMPL family transporter, partial [Christensenellales bacterium]
VQPIITMLLDKPIQKTTHDFIGKLKKKKAFDKVGELGAEAIVRPVARFSVFARIAIIVVAAGLIVPSFIGQSRLQYSYFRMYEENYETPEQILANELGNQTIIAVPLDAVNGTHKEFIEKLLADPNGKVTGVTGAFTTIDIDRDALVTMLEIFSDEEALESMENTFSTLPTMLKDEQIRTMLEEQGVDVALIEQNLQGIDFDNFDVTKITKNLDLSAINTYFSRVNGKWYTMYTLNISGSAEDESAMRTYEYIKQTREEFFGKDGYSIGMLTGSYDLASTTPRDFMVVSIVSAAIIFLIITVLLRNPLKSLILVVIIELGIWINLTLTHLFGENINFMVYIIISSVELGCTVDYAILLANAFERNRDECKTGKECAVKSASEAVPAIFVSALIIIAICLSVNLVSKNLIIKQLTGMLARGAAISFILVSVVQTAVMSLFKTERKKVDYEAKLKELEAKAEKKD